LIANPRVEHAQVPDQRPHRDQWIAPTKTGAPLAARRAGWPCRSSRGPAPTKPTPEPAIPPKSRPDRRSDPLIANPRVEHAQIPAQRPHRDQWIAPTKTGASLAARRAGWPYQATRWPPPQKPAHPETGTRRPNLPRKGRQSTIRNAAGANTEIPWNGCKTSKS
jgi:hypothetical protein